MEKPMRRSLLGALMLGAALTLVGCASMPGRDPLQVTVSDIEPLPGEGLELRMLVKLRVQNPNDVPIEYNGAYVKLDVQDKTFATGVSDEHGTIPRYGEAIIGVRVTASMLRAAVNAFGIFSGQPNDKISYKLEGKIDGPAFVSFRFKSQGEFSLRNVMSP
ncbi:MAG TPA: LEA type 2 family protein [Casimicrobiaceae bacterium]|nr:LEA type 2 family protein [Casimicrobiaceae bacterium]